MGEMMLWIFLWISLINLDVGNKVATKLNIKGDE